MTSSSKINLKKEREDLSNVNKLLDDIHFPRPTRFSEESINCCEVNWLRPHAIVEEPAIYAFDTGVNKKIEIYRKDPAIDWFMIPLATMCFYPKMIYNLFPATEDFSKTYGGMFKMRFNSCGKWVEIVIDDRIPIHTCSSSGTPYFVSHDSGFWLPLLVKAYAKFHGSYERLMKKSIAQAFQDFTSGLSETIDLSEPKPKFHIAFRKYFESACLMTAIYVYKTDSKEYTSPWVIVAINPHEESTTSVVTTSSQRLAPPNITIKLQYAFTLPKGRSVHDEVRCPQLLKLLMKLNSRDNNDGAFWMSFQDFMTTFSTLYVCTLDWGMAVSVRPPEVKMESYKFTGAWYSTNSSSHSLYDPGSIPFWTFPQFKFELREPDSYRRDTRCEFIVSLQQPGHLYSPSIALIGFFIFRLAKENEPIPAGKQFFRMYRPVSSIVESGCQILRRLKQPVGVYLIIPVAEPDNHNDFYLRVMCEGKYKVWGHVPLRIHSTEMSATPQVQTAEQQKQRKYSHLKRISQERSATLTPSDIMPSLPQNLRFPKDASK